MTISPGDTTTEARATRTVAVACIGAWILLTALSLVRHHTFHSSLYDLGIFEQVLWNLAHGRGFASSVCHMNYLGDHFSPSLALLAPLTLLPGSVDVLLVLHAVAAPLTAWNVFRLARRHLAPRATLLVGLGTLAAPPLYCPALADVHPESLVAVALSFALLALDERAFLGAAVALVVALGGKEDSGLLLCPLGVVVAADRTTRQVGVVLAVVSAAYMAVVMGWVMPHLRPPGVVGDGMFYLGRFAHLGASPGGVLAGAVLHPIHAIVASTTVPRLCTLVTLVVPFALAPLRSWRTLAVVPFAAAHYLSSRTTEFFFPYHYLVPVVPVLAWAAIDGAPRTIERWPRAAGVAILASAVLSVGWRFDPEPLTPRSNQRALDEAIAAVPPGEPVCVENWFGAHLASRAEVDFCVLWEWDRGRYAYYGWPENSSARWQLFDLRDTSREHPALAARREALVKAGARVAFERDGVTLLEVDPDVAARAPVILAPPPSDAFRP